MAGSSNHPITIYYDSGIRSAQKFESRTACEVEDSQELFIRVLSPVFFSRISQYRSLSTGLVREGSSKDMRHRTVSLKPPDAHKLLESIDQSIQPIRPPLGWLDILRWRVVGWLRGMLARSSRNDYVGWVAFAPLLFTTFDINVASDRYSSSLYRRQTTQSLIASSIVMGNRQVIAMLDFFIRATLIFWATSNPNLYPMIAHAWAFVKG